MADDARRALITGITGQDGSYLVEWLLARGYEVHGMVRRSSSQGLDRLRHLAPAPPEARQRLLLHDGDMGDAGGLARLVLEVAPHEVYNLAAQSHVRVSFDQPTYTADVNAIGTLRLIEAIRGVQDTLGRQIRFYQASTSELFGRVAESPQTELTPFHPRSPYGVAKLYAHWITVNARESGWLHGSCGILFNHEVRVGVRNSSPERSRGQWPASVSGCKRSWRSGISRRFAIGDLRVTSSRRCG